MYTTERDGICAHHIALPHSSWPEANRIWCGYFHRGVEIQRVEWDEPDDVPEHRDTRGNTFPVYYSDQPRKTWGPTPDELAAVMAAVWEYDVA